MEPGIAPDTQPLNRTFLREWRTFRGLSLREFGDRVGLSASRLSQIEQGKEPYHQRMLERCAAELGCPRGPADILLAPPNPENVDGAASSQIIIDRLENYIRLANHRHEIAQDNWQQFLALSSALISWIKHRGDNA